MSRMSGWLPLTWPLLLGLMALWLAVLPSAARAEYGDVVINQRSDAEGVRPVVFPHWFHRIRFRCKVCHQELGFEMRAGANAVRMNDIVDGKFCGACHNGQVAWGPDRCDLCHSGLKGLSSGIQGGAQTSGPGRW
ncbi:c(7)-type cytochrome triheme domain-containing protein [Sphaerotilus mobilis]|uniref:C(7)-type cytochrome triheme protein n=1 Tax=Sphaerotilus mobilis TaxID=47994 RepID=A0A4Q7LWJ4_9BURK|nr:c(7)-type cytochrome triheme domain-containing protein [Sphaerotilus mobilis]RZS58149.1 c(7)-type cytochrome triheme protein [Sphaerotilus mobilis]